MNHVMVDLETLSTRHDAAILSIGAVVFDPATGQLGERIKLNIRPETSQAAGGHVDAGTVSWWFQQAQEARDRLQNPTPQTLKNALEMLSLWMCSKVSDPADFYVWGNGATFDNVILRNAFRSVGVPAPWSYRRDVCYRTMKAMFPQVSNASLPLEAVPHDALDDAVEQATHLCAIFRYINSEPKYEPGTLQNLQRLD